eukprot:s2061_g11.t1
MGPAAMFTAHTISDDIAANPKYHIWGVLLEKDNDFDLTQFLPHAYADVDDELLIGRIVPGEPSKLTCSSDWTNEAFLNFGKEVADLEPCLESITRFTGQLVLQPEMFRNQNVSPLDLADKVEGPLDDYIRDEFIPRWSERAAQDHLHEGDLSQVAEYGNLPMPCALLVKAAYFVEKEVGDQLAAKRKQQAGVQQNYADLKKRLQTAQERRDEVAKKTCEEIMNRSQDPIIRNTRLARRNQINRVRQGVKKPKKVKKAAQRLTIFEKLQIVEYSDKLIEEAKQLTSESTSSRNKKTPGSRERIKGLNLQAKCKEHFGAKLGGIKVCVLRQQCTEQKWRLLTEKQQKSFYQLPDSVKLSLGLDSIKGYKALSPQELEKRLEASKGLPRLNVPTPVLEDRE